MRRIYFHMVSLSIKLTLGVPLPKNIVDVLESLIDFVLELDYLFHQCSNEHAQSIPIRRPRDFPVMLGEL